MFIDPPAIVDVNVTERCINDFTISWTAASDEEGISYGVTLLPLHVNRSTTVDSYNFTGLMPATSYEVSIFSRINTCMGNPNAMTVTTVAVEVAVPQSELIVMHCASVVLVKTESKSVPLLKLKVK